MVKSKNYGRLTNNIIHRGGNSGHSCILFVLQNRKTEIMKDLLKEYELKLDKLHRDHKKVKISGSRECTMKVTAFAAKSACYIEFIKKLRALES